MVGFHCRWAGRSADNIRPSANHVRGGLCHYQMYFLQAEKEITARTDEVMALDDRGIDEYIFNGGAFWVTPH